MQQPLMMLVPTAPQAPPRPPTSPPPGPRDGFARAFQAARARPETPDRPPPAATAPAPLDESKPQAPAQASDETATTPESLRPIDEAPDQTPAPEAMVALEAPTGPDLLALIALSVPVAPAAAPTPVPAPVATEDASVDLAAQLDVARPQGPSRGISEHHAARAHHAQQVRALAQGPAELAVQAALPEVAPAPIATAAPVVAPQSPAEFVAELGAEVPAEVPAEIPAELPVLAGQEQVAKDRPAAPAPSAAAPAPKVEVSSEAQSTPTLQPTRAAAPVAKVEAPGQEPAAGRGDGRVEHQERRAAKVELPTEATTSKTPELDAPALEAAKPWELPDPVRAPMEVHARPLSQDGPRVEAAPLREVIRTPFVAAASQPDRPTELRLQLSPEHLGRMEIRVVAHEGTVRAHIRVDHDQARDMMTTQVAELRQHLADQGIKLDRLEVSVGQDRRSEPGFTFGQGGHQQHQPQPQPQGPQARTSGLYGDEEIELTDEAQSAGLAAGGLDVRA